MVTRLILLGILAHSKKPIHGYEIKQVLKRWAVGEYANISYGSIYYNLEKMEKEGLVVITQNVTSSLDAIQILTGCTLGNRGLQVEDWGKHTYQFILQRSGICLEAKLNSLPLPTSKVETMKDLEAKIMGKKATLDEVITYQTLLDEMIRGLINSNPEDLFSWRMLEAPPVVEPIPTTVRRCTSCGDMVAEYGMVDLSGGPVCKRCLTVGRSRFPEN